MYPSDTLLFTKWTRVAGADDTHYFLVVACERNGAGELAKVTLQDIEDLSEQEVDCHELEESQHWFAGWR